MQLKRTLTTFLFLMALVACQNTVQQKPSEPEDNLYHQNQLTGLFEDSSIALFSARPVNATMIGLETRLTGGPYQEKLDDYSPAAEAELRNNLRTINQQLKSLKAKDKQSEENRKVMININRYYAGHPDFDIGYIDPWMGLSAFVVNQINGPLIDVPNTIVTNHPITSEQDALDYVERLRSFDVFMENLQKKLKADTDQQWIAPKVIIEKTIAGMQQFIQPTAENHPLVTNLRNKLSTLEGVSEQRKNEINQAALAFVKLKVYPAYEDMIETQKQLLPRAREASGIWAQPNGAAFYADAIRMLGDTDLSAEEIHQVGLQEVERITGEMDAILKSEGFDDGSVGERMLQLNDDPKFLYEDSDAGRAELLDDLNGYIEEITVKMKDQFATAPPYAVEVRKFPAAREASAPGGMYTPPTVDGSQPGIYWINLRDIKANPRFDLKTLTYHEANPGHHWQVALNLAQDSLPMLRRLAPYNAYVEGWALYSEKVAHEIGMYENDPYGDLGRLKAELFRAVRLVVDTGLHHKKWSREEAIKYMADTTGTVASDVVAEIERYMVWPGQALGYKLGMIQMLELRERARQALDEKFDIKAYHDLILLGGAVPMDILSQKVDAWISENS